MGKITFDEKLVIEQFPEQKDWIGPLFRVVNNFMAEVRGALRKGLTFLDNALGMEYEYDFTYQSNTLSFPQKFAWTKALSPRSLQVVASTAAGEATMIQVAWEFTAEGLVQITDAVEFSGSAGGSVADLTAGARYKIRVRVTP